MRVTLTKHHGLGNDFLVLFDDQPVPAAAYSSLAKRWCARRTGLGADGLLVGLTEPGPGADVGMALFNADGSRAEMSGNGIRCLAQAWVARRGQLPTTVRVATDAGGRAVEVQPGPAPDTVLASVDMGTATELSAPPGWATATSAATGSSPTACAHLSLGNPHSVMAVDDVRAVDLDSLGAALPDVNVEVVEPAGPHAVRMRVHERGVGITDACGTGASAVAIGRGAVGPGDAGRGGRNHRAHGRRGCQGSLGRGRLVGSHWAGHVPRHHRG